MRLSITFGLLMIVCVLAAQTPVRQVVAGLGGYYESEIFSSSSTVGEAIINTTAADMYILTEGFQQPDELDLIVGLYKPIESAHAIRLFPNPCANQVTLSIDGMDVNTTVLISIYSNNGKLVKSLKTGLPVKLDLKNEATGGYIVAVWSQEGEYFGSDWLVKQ